MFVEHKLFAPLTFPSYLLLPNTVYEDLFYVKELRCNVCDFRSVYTHKFLMHHVDTYLVFPFSVSNTLALFPSPPSLQPDPWSKLLQSAGRVEQSTAHLQQLIRC